jgi:predicted CoA-binding protein
MEQAMFERGREFLEQGRFAVVGVSRSEKDFSRYLLRELLRRGYDAVPVNPALTEVEGRPCFARVDQARPALSAALLLTPPARTEAVVRECVQAGVRKIWMHRGQGAGAASPDAIALCRANGVELVTDLCPFMALPGAPWPHRLHGFFRRLAPPRHDPAPTR